jgi:hypothetical protein
MIDLRWLERRNTITGVKTATLQYRERRQVMNKKLMAERGSSYREEVWSDWMTVPTVVEEE